MVVTVWLAGGIVAQAEDESAQAQLERAVAMYQAQDYEAALRLVRQVDTDGLSEADRERLGRYVNLTDVSMLTRLLWRRNNG